jgi:tryptophanyl-tRNA synthetase
MLLQRHTMLWSCQLFCMPADTCHILRCQLFCMPADTFYCVVDLHAITAPHDPVELRAATRSVAATYMAAGIDPEKVSLGASSCTVRWR